MKITSATYIGSKPTHTQCPTDGLPEYAFIGRSNVGKSSLINEVLYRRLAGELNGAHTFPGKCKRIEGIEHLEKVIDKVFPKYNDKVVLHKIDVSKKDKNCKALIKEYNVTLVPTTVFKNQDGRILRQVVGTMEPELLESYIEELIRE